MPYKLADRNTAKWIGGYKEGKERERSRKKEVEVLISFSHAIISNSAS
jgi:hypothetical protein